MKRNTSIFIYAFVIFLIAAAFVTGKASASTGCFTDTNGHWAETFICWMKDNGISSGYLDGTFRPENSVTRAELSVLLQKMRSTGVVQFNSGAPGAWSVNAGASSTAYIADFTIQSRLRNSSNASSGTFQTTMTIPSSLYNSKMYLDAVKLCYATPNAGYITAVHVFHQLSSAADYRSIDYLTDITDDGCRTFTFSSTGSVWGGEYLTIAVDVVFPANTDYVNIHSTTAYLTPSALDATAKEAHDDTHSGSFSEDPNSGMEP